MKALVLLVLFVVSAAATSVCQSIKRNVNSTNVIGPITIIPKGIIGDRTIHTPLGIVNIGLGVSSITVSNDLCNTNSIVFAVVRNNDPAAVIKSVTPSNGSFIILLNAATGGETSVGFHVLNGI